MSYRNTLGCLSFAKTTFHGCATQTTSPLGRCSNHGRKYGGKSSTRTFPYASDLSCVTVTPASGRCSLHHSSFSPHALGDDVGPFVSTFRENPMLRISSTMAKPASSFDRSRQNPGIAWMSFRRAFMYGSSSPSNVDRSAYGTSPGAAIVSIQDFMERW